VSDAAIEQAARNVIGILGDDVASGLFDGGVADLGAEALGGYDFGGGAAGFEHGGENFFGDGGGDFGRLHELHQFGQGGGRNRAGADFFAGVLQAAEKFGLHPVGGGFAGSSGLDDGFKI